MKPHWIFVYGEDRKWVGAVYSLDNGKDECVTSIIGISRINLDIPFECPPLRSLVKRKATSSGSIGLTGLPFAT